MKDRNSVCGDLHSHPSLSNFVRRRQCSASGCRSRAFLPPFFLDAVKRLSPRIACPLRVAPSGTTVIAELRSGQRVQYHLDVGRFLPPWLLSDGSVLSTPAFRSVVALRPLRSFQRSNLAVGGFRVTGDSSYPCEACLSKGCAANLSTKTKPAYDKKMTSL